MCLEENYAVGFDNSMKHCVSTFVWTKAFDKVRKDAIVRQSEPTDLGMKKPWILKDKPQKTRVLVK